MRVDALRLEPGFRREAPQDQERAGAGEAASAGVQEQLGPVPPVEERPAAALVAADRLGGRPSDRDDALLAALADAADEAVLEVDPGALEPDRLADAQAGAVEQLDERAIAEVARGDAGGRLDQALGLGRRERAGSVRRRRGSSSAAAGFSVTAPRRTRWRKNERTAAVRRATVAGASPSARSSASQRSSSSVVAVASGRPSQAESAVRSRR